MTGVIVDKGRETRVIHIERQADGSRQVLGGHNRNCADVQLQPGDLNPAAFQGAEFLYFSSTAYCQEPVASATAEAVSLARKNNVLVVHDVNYWPAMWTRESSAARLVVLARAADADVLKVSRSELQFLAGSSEPAAAEELRKKLGIPVLLLTLDKDGTFVGCNSGTAHVPPYRIDAKEPAGAGDAFVAGVIVALSRLLDGGSGRREQLSRLTVAQLLPVVERGNASGAIVASRFGAMGAMPTGDEVDRFLSTTERRAVE